MQEKTTRERNKDKSKQQFLDAVGSILQTKGHQGLKINDIAKTAGLDKKLVYKYFGGTDALLDEYIHTQDFWSKVSTNTDFSNMKDQGEEIGIHLLHTQFDYVFHNKEFQKVLLWGLSEERESLKKLGDSQEMSGEAIFSSTTDIHFGEKAADFRAIMAILISGAYYLGMFPNDNGRNFCGINVQEEEGRDKIKQAFAFLLHQTFKEL